MAKTLELAFALAGKIKPEFMKAAKDATSQLAAVEKQTKAIQTASERRASIQSWKDFTKTIGGAKAAFIGLKNEAMGTIKAIAGFAAGQGLIGGAIYGTVKSSANFADDAIKSAQAVGMTIKTYSELSYAAELSGVSTEQFSTATVKMSKAVKSALAGNQNAADLFRQTGVSLRDASGEIKNADQLMAELSDAFASMPDGMGKTTLAVELFGKSGTKLIPFLNAGSVGLEKMREEAREVGVSLSDLDAKNAEAFNDSFTKIGASLRGISLIVGKHLWPVFTGIHHDIAAFINNQGKWLQQELPGWVADFQRELPEIKKQLRAIWDSVASGAKFIDGIAKSTGGWIPLIKSVVTYWLYWRGIRMGVVFAKTGKEIHGLVKGFLNLQYAGTSVGSILSGAFKGIYGAAKRNLGEAAGALQRWRGTFYVVASAAKDYAVAGAGAIASFAKGISSGLVKAAKASWGFAGSLAKGVLSSLASSAAAAWSFAGSALVAVKTALVSAATAAWGFAAALLANPITWIIAGIVALGAAVYLCVKYWDDITAAMSAAWEWIKGVFVAGWNMLPGWIQDPIERAVAAVVDFGGKILDAFGVAWSAVASFFGQRFDAVKTAFDQGLIAGIVAIIRNFNPVAIFADALNALVKYITGFDIVAAATNLMTRFGEGLLAAWASIKSGIASAVTEWIPGGETLANMASSGANLISSGAGAVADAASGAYDFAASLMPFAEGGIVTRPTPAIVGEAGPEVIIPVSKPARARSLMDAAAGMMGLGGGSGGGNAEYNITFSPRISVSGGGESVAEQVRQSMFRAKEDLRRMLKELALEHSRMAMR